MHSPLCLRSFLRVVFKPEKILDKVAGSRIILNDAALIVVNCGWNLFSAAEFKLGASQRSGF